MSSPMRLTLTHMCRGDVWPLSYAQRHDGALPLPYEWLVVPPNGKPATPTVIQPGACCFPCMWPRSTTLTRTGVCGVLADVIPWAEVERAACALERVEASDMFGLRGSGLARPPKPKEAPRGKGKHAKRGPSHEPPQPVKPKYGRVRKVGYMVKQGQRWFKSWKRRLVPLSMSLAWSHAAFSCVVALRTGTSSSM